MSFSKTEPWKFTTTARLCGNVDYALAVLLGGIFLWGGMNKIASIQTTIAYVEGYKILPHLVVPVVGVTIPIMELGVGLGLLFFGHLPVLRIVAAVMLLGFAGAQGSVLVRGFNAPCGCFSSAEEISPLTLTRSVLLLLVSCLLLARSLRTKGRRARRDT